MLEMGYVPTNLAAVNDLMGGLPVGSAVLLYGPPKAGKTILEAQFGYEVLQTGHSMLIIDTEGSDHSYSDWHERLVKKYLVDANIYYVNTTYTPRTTKENADYSLFQLSVHATPQDIKAKPVNVFIISLRELTEILALFGKPVDIEPNPNGKFTVRPMPGWKMNPALSVLATFIKQYNIGYLAIDSFTNPLFQLGTEQFNLPARAQVIGYWMTAIQGLCEKLRLACTIVAHENQPGNSSPMDKFKRPMPLGGDKVLYNVKFGLYISNEPNSRTPSTEKYKAPTREFWMMRHPSRADWTMYRFLNLTNDGFVDA